MPANTDYLPRVPRQLQRQVIRGVDYAINTWGDAGDPIIVFLHGWGDTGSTFQFVVDEFRHKWFVIAPDWRGFGGTRVAATSYWFADYLADLDALLAVYSPERPVRLVGHSMGGNVGGLYSGAMPERVQAFVNIEGFGLPDTNPGDAPGRYRLWLEKSRTSLAYSEFADFSTLAERIRRQSPRMSVAQAEFVAREWAEVDAGGVRVRADPLHKLPNAVLYRRTEAEACWRQASADVLLVAGAESQFIKRGDAGEVGAVPDLPFPRVSSQMIEDSGHMLHFEQPRRLAQAIEGFLSRT